MLIVLAIYMTNMYAEVLVYLENMEELGKIKTPSDANIYAQLRSSSAIWLVALPLVAGGIGVNLIAGFILARKPTHF